MVRHCVRIHIYIYTWLCVCVCACWCLKVILIGSSSKHWSWNPKRVVWCVFGHWTHWTQHNCALNPTIIGFMAEFAWFVLFRFRNGSRISTNPDWINCFINRDWTRKNVETCGNKSASRLIETWIWAKPVAKKQQPLSSRWAPPVGFSQKWRQPGSSQMKKHEEAA